MWLKLTGALLVLGGCGGLGFFEAQQLKERRRLLETLKRMISQLKGEILYSNLTLPSAFFNTGQRGGGPAGELFLAVSHRMETEAGESFEEVWKSETAQFFARVPLGKAEQDQLLAFGSCLGYLDREMQRRTMEFYLEELEQEIQRLKKEEPEKCRLFQGLGILAGLFLTVVLV